MARGRLHASKIKEAKGIAQAIMEGLTKADQKKPITEILKDHLGRMIDRVDPVELAIYSGLAYAGYELTKDWKGALIGPIGLKLATSPSEIGAATGIAMLAGLGIGFVFNLGVPIEEIKAQIAGRIEETISYFHELAPLPKVDLPDMTYIVEWTYARITGNTPYNYEDYLAHMHPKTEGPPSKPVPII